MTASHAGVFQEPLAGQWEFETSRYAVHETSGNTRLFEDRQGPISQGMGDLMVPFRNGHTYPESLAMPQAFAS